MKKPNDTPPRPAVIPMRRIEKPAQPVNPVPARPGLRVIPGGKQQ